MQQPYFRISAMIWVASIVAVVTIALSLGYGSARVTMGRMEQAVAEAQNFPAEHLSIIYERQQSSHTDFVHLRVDTLYRQIGKGAYRHEVICDREFSLRYFDDGYGDISDAATLCFIEGNDFEWQTTEDEQRQIMGIPCQRAHLLRDGKHWEAWYTTALPRIQQGAVAGDDTRGLILDLRSMRGDYSLSIKNITVEIG